MPGGWDGAAFRAGAGRAGAHFEEVAPGCTFVIEGRDTVTGATELAEAIRSRQASSQEVIDAHLMRIEADDPARGELRDGLELGGDDPIEDRSGDRGPLLRALRKRLKVLV